MNDEEYLRRRIRQAVAKSNLPVAALAKEIGVHRATIYDWINGRRDPGALRIIKLATACGVSVEWLLTGKE